MNSFMNQKDLVLSVTKRQNLLKMYYFLKQAIANLNTKNLKGKYQDAKITVEYYNYDRSNEKNEKSFNNIKRGKPQKKKIIKNNNNNNNSYNEEQNNCKKMI